MAPCLTYGAEEEGCDRSYESYACRIGNTVGVIHIIRKEHREYIGCDFWRQPRNKRIVYAVHLASTDELCSLKGLNQRKFDKRLRAERFRRVFHVGNKLLEFPVDFIFKCLATLTLSLRNEAIFKSACRRGSETIKAHHI